MFTVTQAQHAILEGVQSLPVEPRPLLDAVGGVVAHPILSDLDMPPFDKAAVDGYACRTNDAREGNLIDVVERITAGQQSRCAVASGTAVQVMTGCPVPECTETVVMVEQGWRGPVRRPGIPRAADALPMLWIPPPLPRRLQPHPLYPTQL